MRAFTRYTKRGFTLVELMIVVAIIGVLAALAIIGVTRYLKSAKTSEAKQAIGRISRSAQEAYERETVASELLAPGASSGTPSHSLCTSAAPVPGAVPPATKYVPKVGKGEDFNGGSATAGWQCLKFEINDPIYYQYSYYAGSGYVGTAAGGPDPGADGFEAAAKGDLDGDATEYGIFTLTGKIDTGSKTLVRSTQVYISNEFE